MKHALVAAVMMLGMASPALAQGGGAPGGASAYDPCTVLPSDFFARFQQGSDQHRAESLEHLRSYAFSPAAGDQERRRLICSVYQVRTLYSRRAGRQQTILATESWITGVSGVVAVFSEGAGQTTQQYWGAASLIPVLISRFNANEPIRDLYHGATQGTDWLASRYIGLNADTEQLFRLVSWDSSAAGGGGAFESGSALAASGTSLRTSCQALGTLMAPPIAPAAGAPAAPTQSPFSAGAEGDAQRVAARTLVQRCAEATVAQGQLETFMRSADYWNDHHHRLMAHDVLTFDAMLTQREHDVTYSPFETFATLAAAPFEAAASLVSGQDGREALDRLRVQSAFSGLNMVLQPIDYPATPRDLSAAEMPVGGPPQVLEAWAAYETFRLRYAAAQTLIQRLQTRARADRLGFSYDANANVVTVSLSPPTPPAPATAAVLPPS